MLLLLLLPLVAVAGASWPLMAGMDRCWSAFLRWRGRVESDARGEIEAWVKWRGMAPAR
jgi:hypothetical protein